MISSQVLQNAIDELRSITRIDLCVFDPEGRTVVSTFNGDDISTDMVRLFNDSAADSQVIQGYHFFKIFDDQVVEYILVARGSSEDAYMIGKVAVSEIQNLIVAYKERFDKNNFIQNLLLDERSIILIHELREDEDYEDVEQVANMMKDMLNSEAMATVRISYGTIVSEIKQVSKSYKEAKMALDVGKIFYAEKRIIAYNTLGIGRLIYQLPISLCEMFMHEVFGDNIPDSLDEETLTTINKFFENNLNVSETSRQLYVHRNTLVYRLEKLQKSTGLDIRKFDDALTFKIALMVVNYMKYMENQEY